MIVLGVDTSLRSTGFGVLETCGSKMRALEWGNIPNRGTDKISACLLNIQGKIAGLIERWNPDEASIEKVIYGKNANTMMVLGEARGVVIAAAATAGLKIYEYEPRRVKMAVCGNGLAEKPQVQRMVRTLLALDRLPQNDAADALALAICHVHARGPLLGEKNCI